MTISEALRSGIRSLDGRKRLWFLFYGVTTVWALAVVAPAMAILFGSLMDSAWAERMAGGFDLQWIAEMSAGEGARVFVPAAVAALLVMAIAAIAHLFLVGGALDLFRSREPFSLAAFFQGCGRHFWRFVRLALLSALFYVVVSLVNRALAWLGNKIWGEGSVQGPLVHWGWFRAAIVLALFGLVNLIFDYARIRMVADDSRRAFRSALGAVRFVFANFRKAAGLYLAVWLILLVLLAVYRGAAGIVPQTSLGLVALLFVVRQATVLGRMWTQLLFCAAQTEMYRGLAPVGVAAVPVAAEPVAVKTVETAAAAAPVAVKTVEAAAAAEPVAVKTVEAVAAAEPLAVETVAAAAAAAPVAVEIAPVAVAAVPVAVKTVEAAAAAEPVAVETVAAAAEPVAVETVAAAAAAEPVAVKTVAAAAAAEPVAVKTVEAAAAAVPVAVETVAAAAVPVAVKTVAAAVAAVPVAVEIAPVAVAAAPVAVEIAPVAAAAVPVTTETAPVAAAAVLEAAAGAGAEARFEAVPEPVAHVRAAPEPSQ